MGVESAVFQVRYVGELDGVLERAMSVVGAEMRELAGGSTVKAVVSARDRYWIDVQAWPDRALVSVRLALCNPPEAVSMLRTVLSVLLAASPAVVVEVNGDARLSELGDHSWSRIAEGLDGRRLEFQEHFGEFVAAISSDDVFTWIRER